MISPAERPRRIHSCLQCIASSINMETWWASCYSTKKSWEWKSTQLQGVCAFLWLKKTWYRIPYPLIAFFFLCVKYIRRGALLDGCQHHYELSTRDDTGSDLTTAAGRLVQFTIHCERKCESTTGAGWPSLAHLVDSSPRFWNEFLEPIQKESTAQSQFWESRKFYSYGIQGINGRCKYILSCIIYE
jgi:hypothetical protein